MRAENELMYDVSDILIRTLSALFLCLGVLKLHGIVFPQDTLREYLGIANPIVSFLPNRVVLVVGALAEIVVGTYGIRNSERLSWRAGILLWLALVMVAYRISLLFVHYTGPCGCLLGVNRFLPLRIGTQRAIADMIIVVAILACIFVLALSRWFLKEKAFAPLRCARN